MLMWPGLCPGHSSTRQVSVELALQKDRVCGRSCSTAERLLSTCWLQDLRGGKNTVVGCHFLLQCVKVKVKSLIYFSVVSDS